MKPTTRVLDPSPVADLAAYEEAGGRAGLVTALNQGPAATMAVIGASGLRGRGGAGFPTAVKWQSLLEHLTPAEAATVVVNAAEGEPGSFKDRAIIAANPYRVLEGALIAAVTVGADGVVVATKERFVDHVERLRRAAEEITAAWAPGISIDVVAGPEEYLYGEETALLEVIDGRLPFPRIAPPWRRGIDEAGGGGAAAAGTDMAADGTATPPALVNNVETLANVALIAANGPEWFRQVGTAESPGTIVCTITGHVADGGVMEVPMGTPLRAVIDAVGGEPLQGELVAAMSGVSNPLLPGSKLDTPLTYEAMAEVGCGLGTGGFIVFDESVDPVAVAHGVSRFLAVESCGQCTPCKLDGKAVMVALEGLRRRPTTAGTGGRQLAEVEDHLRTITDGARCFLATQHETVISSLLSLFPEAFVGHAEGRVEPVGPYLIAELEGFVDGETGLEAVYDTRHATKQPDWTYHATDSGRSPADRLDQDQGDDESDVAGT